jgi:sugar-specific transcriptional regulator TrmB
MDLTKLQDTGLNEKESRLYVKLLELNESTVTKLAKETNINRSLLYFILSDLEKRGFVSYIIKNNVRYYKPIEPQKILSLLEEKKKSFESILPELITMSKLIKRKPQIEILEGKEGIKTALNDILRQKKEWFAFNIPGKGPEIMGPMIYAFEKEREKAKIVLNVILTRTEQAFERGKEFSTLKHTNIRYMPEEYSSPASNWIYGDRIVIIFWYKEFPFAVRIIDKDLAESYRNHFKALWKISKER